MKSVIYDIFFIGLHMFIMKLHHPSSCPSSPRFFSSSGSPSCYCCSSLMFVDSFLTDIDECTASTPVCGIHFDCFNTLGSYRCQYNSSREGCQGKKSMICGGANCQNGFQDVTVIRFTILQSP